MNNEKLQVFENSNMFKIFVSYKSEYETISLKFKETLKLWGAGKLEIKSMADISAGEDYRSWITQCLKEANFLILVYTAPYASWDWCLYEVGMFDDGKRPITCVHNPEFDPPQPLNKFQNIPANVKGLKGFLKDLYGTAKFTGSENPINPGFANNKEERVRVSEELEELLRFGVAKQQYMNNYFKIHVKDLKRIKEEKIPKDALVETNAESLALFGLLPKDKWSWGDIENTVKKIGEVGWIDELNKAAYNAARNRIPDQITKKLKIEKRDETYRPVLYRVDYGTEKSIIFYILFVIE